MRKLLNILTKPVRRIIHKANFFVFRLPLLRRISKRNQPRIAILLQIALIFTIICTYLFWDLPLPSQLTSQSKNPVSTQIFDRNHKLIYEIFEEKRRTPVNINELPPYVTQATVSVEDKDFYKHIGFDLMGILRAIYKTSTGQRLEGGSTITQQLVKTTLLSPERTFRRKIREFTLALVIEIVYSKDQILSMYLNNIPYGGTAWGIEAASQTYFGKNSKDLTLGEASLLAGLPQAPTKFSPFGAHPELASERQKVVLRRMVEDKHISEDEARKAESEKIVFTKQAGIKAPHFSLYVKDQLVEKYGQDIVEHGGLRVTTTLDLDLQNMAQETVKTEVDKLTKKNVGNGAAVITNPKTGEIYAMVGSKDYFAEDEDGKFNVVFSNRQPGSSIKPLNYALGIMKGKITASSPLADVPTCFGVTGQPDYCPVNYDGTFHGITHPRFALGNSYNIPAVRTLALNGVNDFIEFANRMGISSFEDPARYGLSLTLGGGEVKMIDMAKAFGVFANSGVKQSLLSILKVEDYNGNVLEEAEIKDGDRILPTGVAYIISHILYDNNARSAAFGTSSALDVAGHPEVSVKTGTTNDRKDNWTIGYTPEIVVAVWVGNNNNEAMSSVTSGITGASPIWNKIMKFSLNTIESGGLSGHGENREKHGHVYPVKTDDIVGTNICATTGELPAGPSDNPGCPTRFEFFLEEYPPKPSSLTTRPMLVYKDTGMLSKNDASPEQIETRDKQIIEDPLGTLVCLDCPTQTWDTFINPAKLPNSKFE